MHGHISDYINYQLLMTCDTQILFERVFLNILNRMKQKTKQKNDK